MGKVRLKAQIGTAPGNYIPNAPAIVASAGITLGEKTGPFVTLRWRYLGSSPLTEDNASPLACDQHLQCPHRL